MPRPPLAWAALAFALGCLGPATEQRGGTALYPNGLGHLPPAQVARLDALLPGGTAPGGGTTSFIMSVDGRDVSALDTAFELYPGCHLVKTASGLVVTGQNVTFTAQLGPRVFPFRMKAGYEYSVVVRVADPSVSVSHVDIFGTERDPNGARTQEIRPAANVGDLQACKAWTPPP